MPCALFMALLSLPALLLLSAPASFALTAEEVLKLKAAGVSEETIQLLLQKAPDDQLPSDIIEQGYATEHIGTWRLRNGQTIHSTGRRQLPLHYPNVYPPLAPYSPPIYPYVIMPPSPQSANEKE